MGLFVLVIAVAATSNGLAQSPPPVPESGKTDPTQLQRERELLDLRPIERPKPEYEILTGPDQGPVPGEGKIVIIPDEPAKTPPPSDKGQEGSTQKKQE
jgi:hypothetical protein